MYLDNSATTAIDPKVLAIYYEALQEVMGNPSSIHYEGQVAKASLQQARHTIAKSLGVLPNEIIFTGSATESSNALLRGFFGYAPKGHAITSSIEHAAIWSTFKDLEKRGLDVTFLPCDASGAIDPEQVRHAMRPDTKLISIMAVNNETGVCSDIDAIAQIAESHGCAFIVDGVALLGKRSFKIHPAVSAMIFSGHKIHAPKGISFSFIRKKLRLDSFMTGGEQEFGRRAGTENVAGCVALASAVALSIETLTDTVNKIQELRDYFEARLKNELAFIRINGTAERVCTTSSITFIGIDAEALLMYADLHGLSCSMGSACATGALEPSRVLLEMGMPRQEAVASLRFSLSRFTTRQEIDRAVDIIVSGVGVQK